MKKTFREKACVERRYAGLTDHPENQRQEHGNPMDWMLVRKFVNEPEARNWEAMMQQFGCISASDDAGWRYGYTYTITDSTIE